MSATTTRIVPSRDWRLLIAAACVLLAAGCTGSGGEKEAAAQKPPSTVAIPETTGMPERGTCWDVATENQVDYRFDDSPKVPCSEEHTTQTTGTISVPEATVAMAKRVGDDCWNKARLFIGVDLDHWIPWQPMVFLPSKQQVADGAKWIRCDVGIPAHTTGGQLLPVSSSVDSAALDPPLGLRGCTLRDPHTRREPQHECESDHAYESTGTLAFIAVTRYPSRATLERQGTRLCRRELTADQRSQGLTALAVWDPPGSLGDGELVAACWAHHPDRRLLPPR
jgi:Septum formation